MKLQHLYSRQTSHPTSGRKVSAFLLPFLLVLFHLMLHGAASGQSLQPTRVRVNGIDLSYIEAGHGDPLILLHGGAFDYRGWAPQWDSLVRKFHVISYSRRYNFPNKNALITANYSALIDAEDLAALIRKLKLGPAHLVGASAGAFTALALAVAHPEMVRSLALAEPPVHQWIRDLPDGEPVYQEFIADIWEPVAETFKKGDSQEAMRLFVNGLTPGRFESLPPEARAIVVQNAPAIEAFALSSDPFPNLPKEQVRKLKVPVLIITGEKTIKIHKIVNEEIARLLPAAEKATIPSAGHSSARENPQAFNEALLRFFANHSFLKEVSQRLGSFTRRSGEFTALPETHGGA